MNQHDDSKIINPYAPPVAALGDAPNSQLIRRGRVLMWVVVVAVMCLSLPMLAFQLLTVSIGGIVREGILITCLMLAWRGLTWARVVLVLLLFMKAAGSALIALLYFDPARPLAGVLIGAYLFVYLGSAFVLLGSASVRHYLEAQANQVENAGDDR
ncbi:MAG: hypothetical protein ACOY3P_06770 [Planctomycetota bacterium]